MYKMNKKCIVNRLFNDYDFMWKTTCEGFTTNYNQNYNCVSMPDLLIK